MILIVCTASTIDSYEKSTSYVENGFTNSLKNTKESIREFNSIPGIQQYQAFAGINAGYGFFAPNVASSYILKVSIYDKNKNLVKESYFPPFKSKEGLNRYHTLLGYFQDRLTILENKLQKKKSTQFNESDKYGEFLDIFIKSIGRYYYKEYNPENYNVSCTLYLHHHPLMEEIKTANKNKPVLIKLLDIDAKPLKKN
ncbi:hypothetical protein [Chryseobacterium oryctis]|uniref:DUF4294 domain-containing protein n=1 Tax=Chryseobacterium oryctis TaxID=2952618 RepID=A0ABT3HPF0_9FLAO|nr:hypothetical protein [Chryseobacterium oryctis]MCW3161652.1 hypothetical protein [Chryseobacterium oryctis]